MASVFPYGLGIAVALGATEGKLDLREFQVLESESGSVNYYRVVKGSEGQVLEARYRPSLDSVTLAMKLPDGLRGAKVKGLHWRWRVLAFPKNGNDCVEGRADSAAGVFVTFKRGFKYYNLKFVWSSEAPKGQVCDLRRGLFHARDTIILESGGPLNAWVDEEIDPRAEFLKHFEPEGSLDDVPDLVGIGIMTDGDQTQSPGEADYAQFTVRT
jgi:hypothetical protein